MNIQQCDMDLLSNDGMFSKHRPTFHCWILVVIFQHNVTAKPVYIAVISVGTWRWANS